MKLKVGKVYKILWRDHFSAGDWTSEVLDDKTADERGIVTSYGEIVSELKDYYCLAPHRGMDGDMTDSFYMLKTAIMDAWEIAWKR